MSSPGQAPIFSPSGEGNPGRLERILDGNFSRLSITPVCQFQSFPLRLPIPEFPSPFANPTPGTGVDEHNGSCGGKKGKLGLLECVCVCCVKKEEEEEKECGVG